MNNLVITKDDNVICQICGRKTYYTGEQVIQLDEILREKGWLNPEYGYLVYKCLTNSDQCEASRKGFRYIKYKKDNRIEQMKRPLKLYSPPFYAGE